MQPTPSQVPKKKKLIGILIFIVPLAIIIALVISLAGRHKKPQPATPAGSAFNTAMPSPNLPKKD